MSTGCSTQRATSAMDHQSDGLRSKKPGWLSRMASPNPACQPFYSAPSFRGSSKTCMPDVGLAMSTFRCLIVRMTFGGNELQLALSGEVATLTDRLGSQGGFATMS